jgi:methyl-accepting chemotaxis protein
MEQRSNEVGGVLAREVAFRLGEFRRFFMQRVHEINDMTAREVMGAVTNISAVVDGASAHIRRVKQMLTSVDGGQGQMGVADAIAKQSKALKQFLESVSRDIGRQEAVAARAQEHLQRITKASRDTAQLANSAKLLAVNARIEAARVGGNGNCFSTIASEMQQLAEQITQANRFIDEVSARLSQDLPEVAVSARDLRALCDELSGKLSVTTTQVNHEVEKLRATVREALSASDREIAELVVSSQNALSHLQFQDVVAQGLGRMEGGIVDLQLFHAESNNLQDSIAPAEHREIGGEKDVDQQNAGEVMMF